MKTYTTEIPKGKYTAMKRILPLVLMLAASSQALKAQQGFGTSNPAPSSVIDMTATNKGALLPRIALTSTTVAAPVNTPANALTVFNTATAGDVTPGYYYWSVPQNKWVRLLDANTAIGANNWNVELTTTPATLNTQNIYQNGFVGIGNFTTEKPVTNLDVKGSVRVGGIHADEKNGTSPIGAVSFSTGNNNKVSSFASGALGVGNTVTANMSFAFNDNNTVNQSSSVAFGSHNTISNLGHNSAVFNSDNHINAAHAVAFGRNHRISSAGSAAFGYKNAITGGNPNGGYVTWVPTDALFQIGNAVINTPGGSFPGRNAFTVLKNGNIAMGLEGEEDAAKPTERLDIGLGDTHAGNKGSIRIRSINTPAYAGNTATDRIVVADNTGVLKTVAASSIGGTEPWRIQTTTNSATANTDAIYQTGNVAVGDFSAAASTKKMEVKGNFKAEVATGNISFGTEVAHPLVSDGALHYWLDGATRNYRSTAASSLSAALEAKTGTTTNTISTSATQAAMASVNGTNSLSTIRNTNTGEFFMETFNVTGQYGSTISLQNNGLRLVHTTTAGSADPFPNSHRTELLVQKTNGIGIDLRDAAGAVKANYFLPVTSGTAGQVLTKGTGNSTVWATPVALPKFFYMPSIIIPTSLAQLNAPGSGKVAGDSFTDATRQGTIDLHARYTVQFGTPMVSNAGKTTTLPTLTAAQLDYNITWYDTSVFSSVAVSNSGILTYTVAAGADITVGSFMNIVFAVK